MPKQAKRPWAQPKPSKPRAFLAANPVNGPIVSPTPVKRPRSVSYESDSSISSATSYESASADSDSSAITNSELSNSGISDYKDQPRKKRKPNSQTMAYYHRCLGHSEDIQQLTKYGINLTKKVDDKPPCVSYMIKKIQQVKHTSHIRPGKRPLDLIHSDIDKIKVTRNGFKYYITFMNDYTKRSEVEVLRHKSETFPTFRRYLMRNKREDCRCNRLRTDWKGEYQDHEFDR